MQITDPIADMLTRIRNAGNARHASVDVPASKMKKAIAQILLDDIDERYKEINTLYINKVLAKQEKFTNYSNNKM